MMTPKDIISRHICGIEGIRIPFAKIIVENILHELKDEGYVILEEREMRKLVLTRKELKS